MREIKLDANGVDSIFTKTGNLNAAVIRRDWFLETELYKAVQLHTKVNFNIDNPKKFRKGFLQALHATMNGLTTLPKCQVCNINECVYDPFCSKTGEYKNTCNNRACIATSTISKSNNTKMEKYGALVSPKQRQATIDRVPSFLRKSKETVLKKYGVTNVSMIPGNRIKSIESRKNNPTLVGGINAEKHATNLTNKITKYQNGCSSEINILSITAPQLDKLEKFPNANKLISFTCQKCENSETLPYETYSWRKRKLGTPCVNCSNVKLGSLSQREIYQFIIDTGTEAILNDRTLIAPKELDIVIPSKNLAIEFNGVYWHSFNVIESEYDKNYHANKTEAARKVGLKLIHIFENEWILKKDIVKSRILSQLGKTTKIYARKTTVENISSANAAIFLNQNHIQGRDFSKINVGLFYEKQLAAVMTFSKPRFNKNYEWELVRYASAKNTTVVGGASKLLSHFIKMYKPKNIISYADARWSEGNLYNKLGFSFLGKSRPSFYYVDPKTCELHNRMKFQKHKLANLLPNFDDKLTAEVNMFNAGYRKIWDAGTSKWVMNLNL